MKVAADERTGRRLLCYIMERGDYLLERIRRDLPKKRVLRLLYPTLLLAVLFAGPEAFSSSLEIGEPIMHTFLPEVYGGNLQVWVVEEDHRGVMYFGTGDGIVEFDGAHWRKIEVPNDTGIRKLAVGEDGEIYAAGAKELGYLASDSTGQLSYVSLRKHLQPEFKPFEQVTNICPTPDGVYFITNSETGILLWDGGKFDELPSSVSYKWHRRRIQLGDDILAIEKGKLIVISKGSSKSVHQLEIPEMESSQLQLLPFPDENCVLVRILKQGMFKLCRHRGKSGEMTFTTTKFQNEIDEMIGGKYVYSTALLGDDRLAIGTLGFGVFIIDRRGTLVRRINENRGLLSDSVFGLKEDRFGNLWAGVQGGIAYIHTSSPLSNFGKKSGLPSTVTSVTKHNGSVYAGVFGKGPMVLSEYKPSLEHDKHAFVPVKGPDVDYGWDFISVDETLLAASDSVFVVQGDQRIEIEKSPTAYGFCPSRKFPGRIYLGVAEPSGGGVGIIEYREVTRPDNTSAHEFSYRGKLKGINTAVQQVAEDADGNLLISQFYNGVSRIVFHSDNWDEFDILKLGPKHGLPTANRNQFYRDNGTIFVGADEGVLRYDPSRFGPTSETMFFPGWNLRSVDDEGSKAAGFISALGENRWLVTPLDVHGIVEQDAEGHFHSENRPFRSLPDLITRAHVDSAGVAWLPTRNGVYRFDPTISKDYAKPFSAMIRSVKTNLGNERFKGTYFDPHAPVDQENFRTSMIQPEALIPTLEYVENGLTFTYSALFFEHMDKTVFQTKLVGFDEQWSEWTNKTHKEYTNVPEGNFTFSIRAKNIYGTVGADADYRFKILPPWYRTFWAYVTYVFGFVLLIATALGLNSRRLLAAKRKLEGIVKERTAEVMTQKSEIERQRDAIEIQKKEIESQKTELEVAFDQLTEANDALWGEMELAKKIQTVLLPEDPAIPGYEITGYMNTADQVGGDYYDVINMDGNYWLVIGDVSGHGVTAGLVMMMVQTSINNTIDNLKGETPAAILSSVNRTIYKNIKKLGESKYMTLMLLSFEPDGTIRFSGLHQDIIVYRRTTQLVETVETRGFWLGIADDIEGLNQVDELHLDPGDTMLLFTDGIVEAKDKDGQMYEPDRLKRVFEMNGAKAPPEIRDSILDSLDGYTTDDDVTMMVVRRN